MWVYSYAPRREAVRRCTGGLSCPRKLLKAYVTLSRVMPLILKGLAQSMWPVFGKMAYCANLLICFICIKKRKVTPTRRLGRAIGIQFIGGHRSTAKNLPRFYTLGIRQFGLESAQLLLALWVIR